jgi:hypothetical protein
MSGYSGGGSSSSLLVPYASGSWHVPEGFERLAGGAAAAAGTIRLVPGGIRKAVTIADLAVRINTTSASGNFQLSVYGADPSTNMPTGAPLYTSASQSTASAGLIDIASVNLALAISLYWFGVQADTNGASVAFIAPDVSTVFLQRLVGAPSSANILANAANAIGLAKTGTFGTWPTFTGNFTNDGFTQSTTGVGAAVAFKPV